MAVETQVSPTPEAQVAATPTGNPGMDPATGNPGTAETTSGESASVEAQPTEEQFGGVDIKSLPKELQSLLKEKHDAMLRDYKTKTTSIAEERKQLQAAAQKAQALDELLANQDVVQFLNNRFSPKSNEPEVPLSPEQALAQEVMAIKAQLQKSEAEVLVTKFAEAADEKGAKLRPDFDDLEKDGLISGFLKVNQPTSTADFAKKVEEAYSWAASIKNQYIEIGRKKAHEELMKKAQGATLPPSASGKTSYAGSAKPSVKEAVEMAMRGERVPK